MRLLYFSLSAFLSASVPMAALAMSSATDSLLVTDYGRDSLMANDTVGSEQAVIAISPDSVQCLAQATMADALTLEFIPDIEQISIDTTSQALLRSMIKPPLINIYQMPYSLTGRSPNWHRMWINTAVLSGAFISTLFVLECLPEDATNWNRSSIQSVPLFRRWYRNIFIRDPEWDHDNAIFNYVLHPYAGAVYFMSARSQGFNFWQSFLYSFCISSIGWEFGIEAFMERPSYQDIVITPVVGSIIGELFYKLKRNIVSHDYRLAGSPVLGNIVAFLIDPVNELVDLFRGRDTHKLHLGRDNNKTSSGVTSALMPTLVGGAPGISFTCTF